MASKGDKKGFEKWLKAPKPKITETPRSGDVIIQVFTEKEETPILLNHDPTGKDIKYKVYTYPYALVLKSNPFDEHDYPEGSVVYLTDNLLLTEDNPAWLSWREKIENQKPTPHDPEPPRFIGGLNELAQFRFKKNKLSREDEPVDEELFQIPIRIIRGSVL